MSESWAWKRGDEEAKEAKEVEWCCGVCKRQNRVEDQNCFTCFTAKDYDAGNLGNLGKGKAQKQQAKKGALPTTERFHLRGSVALSLCVAAQLVPPPERVDTCVDGDDVATLAFTAVFDSAFTCFLLARTTEDTPKSKRRRRRKSGGKAAADEDETKADDGGGAEDYAEWEAEGWLWNEAKGEWEDPSQAACWHEMR